MNDLAERMCEGASSPLLLSLVRSKRFSRAELSRFREILDESPEKARERAPKDRPRKKE
jgi:hypothetical protein